MRLRSILALLAGTGLAASLAGCGTSLQSLPKLGGIGGATYPLRAEFSNVLNLPANAQVRNGAEIVGDVSSITLKGYTAVVNLAIKKSYRVPTGSGAEIRFDNPLGEEYVALQPPAKAGGGHMNPGAMIAESRTVTAPTVADTLGALATVINGGGIGDIQTIVKELDATFGGHQPQIRRLIGELDTAFRSLAGGTKSVDAAVAAIGRLAKALNKGGGTIASGLKNISPAIAVLASQNRQFAALLGNLSRFSQVANAVTDKSGTHTVAALKALVPVVHQIVAADHLLPSDLNQLETFEALTPKIAPGNYLQASVSQTVVLNSAPSTITRPAVGQSTSFDRVMTLMGVLEAPPKGGAR